MIKNAFILVVIGVVFWTCSSVPITGREQLNLVSNSEIIPVATQQYDSIIRTAKLSTDQNQVNMVRTVGGKIQKAVERYMAQNNLSSQLDGFKWEFNVIDDPKTVNAWCMPGGKVAFYTGIMPICQDEKGVAVVMGHEVSHAIANHGRERMSQAMIANMGLSTLSAAMGQNAGMTKQLMLQAVGVGAQIGMLKFSRQDESEADHLGLIFMSMAGYDPNNAVSFWERMDKMSGGGAPPEWLATHPANSTRIADLKKELPEAMKYYNK
jgi:predicted Zn-dependent protease